MQATYTGRRWELAAIANIDGSTIRFTSGWCFGGAPEEALVKLNKGEVYLIEFRGFGEITGMAKCLLTEGTDIAIISPEWIWRKSDEDLDREHIEFLARSHKHAVDRLEANREDWTRREAALPLPLKRRLERFHAKGGKAFDLGGWGYELTVSELAVLYDASKQEDTEGISAFASQHGTSGNQHDFAKVLSKYLTDDPTLQDVAANFPSALRAITGDAYYSSRKF